MNIQRVTLIGLGAIGAVYASKLNATMQKSTFLVVADEERKARLDQGILINYKRHYFNVVTPDEQVEPADLVIFSTKFNQLDQAIRDVKNHVGENTVLLSLLNGISSEDRIAEAYGQEKVVYGKSFGLGATRTGHDIVYTALGHVPIGEPRGETRKDRVLVIQKLFEDAGIPCKISEDILRDMWWKFMVNVGSNQVSAVVCADYGDFKNIPEVSEMCVDVMREVIAVAQKQNIDLKEEDIVTWKTMMSTYDDTGKTSTLQDIEAKRKSEVELFAGTMIAMGEKYNIPTPLNRLLFRQIRTIEKKNGLK